MSLAHRIRQGAGWTLVLALAGCQQSDPVPREAWPALVLGQAGPRHNLDSACVADYQPGVDYFPDKLSFRHSTQLSVEYGLYYKRLQFTPSINTGETLSYLFVQCGAPTPAHAPHTTVIQVPVQRLVAGDPALLGALDELGMVDRLHGVANPQDVTVPAVRDRIQAGQVTEMRGLGHASIEPIMAAQADVYLSFYSAYPDSNLHPRLHEMGVRALVQADHHETHPLGRAEWLKLLALLGNREARAQALFDAIETEYTHWRQLAAQASRQPLVLAGHVAGRDSFETFARDNHRARLIRDAGGKFALDAVAGTSSLVYLPFELAYVQGAQAEVWLGTLGGQASLQAWRQASSLHGWFLAARRKQVYAWDRGYAGAWAAPLRDQGLTRPHVQLQEAVQVLHPELAAGGSPAPSSFQFLRKLP